MKIHAAAVLAFLLLSGCGEDTTPAPKQANESPARKAPPGDVPSAEPELGHIVFTFALDIEAAKADGRLPADADPKEVLAQTLVVLEERLRTADVGKHRWRDEDPAHVQLGFEALAEDARDQVPRLLTRTGTLEFLIEVLPDEEYRKRLGTDEEPPARLGLWAGTAEAFAAFKKSESERWARAKAEGKAYAPSNPAYRLVLEHDKDGSAPGQFHVLEVPAGGERFDGGMLVHALVSQDPSGGPVVVFEIREAWQDRFEAWTTRNLRLPVAIVLDGTFHTAPVIRAPLSRNVQITLGQGSREEMEREAKALVTVLQTGALKVAPRLVSIEER